MESSLRRHLGRLQRNDKPDRPGPPSSRCGRWISRIVPGTTATALRRSRATCSSRTPIISTTQLHGWQTWRPPIPFRKAMHPERRQARRRHQRVRLALAEPRRHADHADARPLPERPRRRMPRRAQRFHMQATWLAADTEFWRAHRKAAAVMHFTTLGYCRPDGQTCDHWKKGGVASLQWEPEFYRYVRDAFAPVGLMVDYLERPAGPRAKARVPVVLDQRSRPAVARAGRVARETRRPGACSKRSRTAGWRRWDKPSRLRRRLAGASSGRASWRRSCAARTAHRYTASATSRSWSNPETTRTKL